MPAVRATPDPTAIPTAVALFASSECEHCAAFKPAFRAAARQVSSVPFFECDTNTDPVANATAVRYGVSALPTVLLMRHGTPVWRIEGGVAAEEIVARGHDPSTVRRVLHLVRTSEYKRHQAAPGLIITSKAFGPGRRMPIAQGFSA